MSDKVVEHEAWRARAAGLAALGALLGLLVDLLLTTNESFRTTEEPLRLASATLLVVGGLAFAFTLERVRPLWSVLFALASGIVAGLVFLWNGSPSGWNVGDGWRLFSALLVVAVAAPLLQSARDQGRFSLAAGRVHAHAWTNLVLWLAAWAFVLVSWLLAQLLAELFRLIGLDLLRDLLRKDWFTLMLIGAALGAAIGLLRDRDQVLGLMQRVVTTVLSVLAPVLAAGLVLFVLALPFTGLEPLWRQTSATTPILLLAIAGAFFLANAVIGNSPEEEASNRLLRYAAMALAAVMAPLALVAAISTWLRIDQYGFTPERLWGLVFVVVVLMVALGYLWALLRGRRAWGERLRPTNVRLAVAVCVVALLLATPLVDFGAISTRDQLARLRSGEVAPAEFDWAALRFDFGPAGRRALVGLRANASPEIRRLAARALGATERYRLAEADRTQRRTAELGRTIRTIPTNVPVPAALREAAASQVGCAAGHCILFWRPGQTRAVAVGFRSDTSPAHVAVIDLTDGRWQASGPITDTKMSAVGARVPGDRRRPFRLRDEPPPPGRTLPVVGRTQPRLVEVLPPPTRSGARAADDVVPHPGRQSDGG